MKIIKKGDDPAAKFPKTFVCTTCGCEFVADNTEYLMEYKDGVTTCIHACPTCGEECRAAANGE